MLRKIAAGTSAAVVVAGLAAAPAVAAGLPASSGDVCGDTAQTEQNTVEGRAQGFVFGQSPRRYRRPTSGYRQPPIPA